MRRYLLRLIPYMLVKREQARLLLEFVNMMPSQGGRLSMEDRKYRALLAKQIAALKR